MLKTKQIHIVVTEEAYEQIVRDGHRYNKNVSDYTRFLYDLGHQLLEDAKQGGGKK